MKQQFKETGMKAETMQFLQTVNAIITDYQAQGYTLTLRQLYYQLVSRDVIPNEDRQYKKLSRILSEGRLAGIVDWSAIEDRLRQVRRTQTWKSPKEILRSAMLSFKFDRLADQENHVEVWVEKDALSQVVWNAASKYQIPVMVNRGYGSVSAMYDSYLRIWAQLYGSDERDGKDRARILYLGDHDPSGLDMVRDINDRLKFMLDYDGYANRFTIEHIAITKEQIQQYDPPPNPAKVTDSRSTGYIEKHGPYSWEVDALEPSVLDELITAHILEHIDASKYDAIRESELVEKSKIGKLIAEL